MKLEHDNRDQSNNKLREALSELDGELLKVPTDYMEISELRKIIQGVFEKHLS